MNLLYKLVVSLLLLHVIPFAFAGSQPNGPPRHKPEDIVSFAKKVEKSLATKRAHVAIIARIGEERSGLPKGISFTHTALAVYSKITGKDGKVYPGYTLYNLYQVAGKEHKSELVRDFPVDFFSGAYELKAGVIIPSKALQQRLLAVISSATYRDLHNSDYSIIANPFTLTYQNCTEHTLDVVTAAIYQTDNLSRIKTYQKAYFTPQRIHISRMKLALGSVFARSVSISDHPSHPETATFSTIGKFLNDNGAASEIYYLTH
ncbi:DUF2145 domain-containing protein [Veronia pacifica]|uniref:DUF2145 domain-containing protein n=1 Tax=Veronia pacifica TaxID=1080227 RepID=A0A1C3EPQ3_9GAMM|nr:DUF2145 domain-containing protein [Veronia pacifica]ODA35244.1 hypothetical protein A8L45_04855 [Veronia pacifica]